jgi:hypothetical protein
MSALGYVIAAGEIIREYFYDCIREYFVACCRCRKIM